MLSELKVVEAGSRELVCGKPSTAKRETSTQRKGTKISHFKINN